MKRKIIDDDFLSRLESVSLYLKTPMQGFFGGNHRAPSYGSTVEFADFREYVPGDDIRRIDWNLYGRFEKHFIRLFVDERQMHTQIFLDCSASMYDVNPEKAAAALRIAAAFGYLSTRLMDRTSYKLIQCQKSADLCGVITGKESFFSMIDQLEKTSFRGTADLEAAVLNCVNPGYDDGLTVIISDFLTESNWKKAVDYLVYRHRDVLLVQVLSPEELDPGFNGRLQLVDTEAEEAQDQRNLKMKITRSSYDAYKEALKDYLEEVRLFCVSRHADFISVRSDASIEKVLFEKWYEAGGN